MQEVDLLEHVLPLGDNFTTYFVAFAPSGTVCHETFVPDRMRFIAGERGAQRVVDSGLGILATTFKELAAPYSSVTTIGKVKDSRIGSNVDFAEK